MDNEEKQQKSNNSLNFLQLITDSFVILLTLIIFIFNYNDLQVLRTLFIFFVFVYFLFLFSIFILIVLFIDQIDLELLSKINEKIKIRNNNKNNISIPELLYVGKYATLFASTFFDGYWGVAFVCTGLFVLKNIIFMPIKRKIQKENNK